MPCKSALLPAIAVLALAAKPVAAQPATTRQAANPATRAAPRPRDSAATRILPVISSSLTGRLRLEPALRRRSRAGHAVIGGLIGGAAGVIVCTAISNYVNSVQGEGSGFSTCTTSGYTAFILGGVALGAAIGALVK